MQFFEKNWKVFDEEYSTPSIYYIETGYWLQAEWNVEEFENRIKMSSWKAEKRMFKMCIVHTQ